MIAYLRGQIINKANNYLIVEVSGLGYQVFVGENLFNELKKNTAVELYTYHQVREEASDLYGFKKLSDLELFELLLSVSGVGPKSALGVLSIASADDIKETIIRGDANLLTKVAGIGKKTAERLVLELKNKVLRTTSGDSLETSSLGSSDELDALMSLGYSLSEARSALNELDPALKDSGERVKAALKKMAKR
jgi:Holliday junction DNA helicase RuvA